MANPLNYIAEPLRGLAVEVADLNPDAANARTHSARNLDAIARSLARWGQRQPIVVQKQGMIVRAGNGRLEAAKLLGWTHIAAIVVDEDSAEATAYAIADNRTAELAGWDDESLAALLQSLDDEDRIDAGFSDEELQELIDGLEPELTEESPGLDIGGVEYRVIVKCGGESEQSVLIARLEAEGYECQPLIS